MYYLMSRLWLHCLFWSLLVLGSWQWSQRIRPRPSTQKASIFSFGSSILQHKVTSSGSPVCNHQFLSVNPVPLIASIDIPCWLSVPVLTSPLCASKASPLWPSVPLLDSKPLLTVPQLSVPLGSRSFRSLCVPCSSVIPHAIAECHGNGSASLAERAGLGEAQEGGLSISAPLTPWNPPPKKLTLMVQGEAREEAEDELVQRHVRTALIPQPAFASPVPWTTLPTLCLLRLKSAITQLLQMPLWSIGNLLLFTVKEFSLRRPLVGLQVQASQLKMTLHIQTRARHTSMDAGSLRSNLLPPWTYELASTSFWSSHGPWWLPLLLYDVCSAISVHRLLCLTVF